MPELPEVETVVRDLKPKLEGQVLNSFKIYVPRVGKVPANILKNNLIKSVTRRAKYIIFELDRGYLVFHLRMTGRIIINHPDGLKHISFKAILNSGDEIYFKDVRKFGTVAWYKDLTNLEKKLGVEPLTVNFNYKFIKNIAIGSRNIKSFLLDQKNIAGIGNIYADEILWLSQINPNRKVNTLSDSELKLLVKSTKSVLAKAIRHNGTTFINFQYGEQKIGNYANYLNVFTKADKPCKRCKTKIIKIKVAQRGTYLCTECQR